MRRRVRRTLIVLAAFALVAAVAIFYTVRAQLGSAPTAKPSGSSFTDYERPFGATAPWNVPVSGLKQDPRSSEWAERFWLYAIGNTKPSDPDNDGNRGKHGVMFGLDDDPNSDFSVAVYRTEDATTTRKVAKREGWAGYFNLNATDEIPWNPGWRASTGSDALMVILDPKTGRQWLLWGLVQNDASGVYNDSQCWGHIFEGYQRDTHLCAGGAMVLTDPSGKVADYRTYTGNQPYARGVGIQELAMLTFPTEVANGAIEHALMMPIYNTMDGPACDSSVTDTSDPRLGTSCARAIAPAGNLEGTEPSVNCGPNLDFKLDADTIRSQATPEGMRFALDISDDDIDRWLDDRGYTGQLRRTARIFAVALRDYGWFITDTSCFAADFQVAGGANPTTAKEWRSLGIRDTGRDLLYGLITKDRIVTIEPATNNCADGTTSKFDCPAGSSGY